MSTFDRIPPPASPAAPGVSGSLPAGWVSHKDPVTGKTFFHNELTKVTQWDAPTSAPSVVAPVMTVPPLPSAPAPPLPPTPPPASALPPPPASVPPGQYGAPGVRPGSYRDPNTGVEMRSPGVPYVASSSYIMKGPSEYLQGRPSSINRGVARPPSTLPRPVSTQRPASYRPPSVSVRPPTSTNYNVYTPPPAECAPCAPIGEEQYECEVMDCVNCDMNEGGQEEDLAPQRLPIIIVSAFLMAFSVVSFGLGKLSLLFIFWSCFCLVFFYV